MNYNRERAAPRSNVMFLQQLGTVEGATFDGFHGPIMARRGCLAFSDSLAILQCG
jgi:hypothetical protein